MGKSMEKAQNPNDLEISGKLNFAALFPLKFTKTAMKFLGVQAAKKCTAPNRCEEREKR